MARELTEVVQVRLSRADRERLAQLAARTVGGASALIRKGLRLLPEWEPPEHFRAGLEPLVRPPALPPATVASAPVRSDYPHGDGGRLRHEAALRQWQRTQGKVDHDDGWA